MSAVGSRYGQITPCLRYKDAPAAIDWLCRVVGFRPQLVVPDEDGGIAHAQLILGNGMVMLGSDREDGYGFGAPGPEGTGASLNCLIIPELDGLFAQVAAAGAVALEGRIVDTDYGSRAFTLRDPEGHLWHFGTYDPWDGAHGPQG
jgi:uncharacterized glyoxalase superfamily protein PhnB